MLESIVIIIYTVCTLNTTAMPTNSTTNNKIETVISDDSDGILEILIIGDQG